MLHTLIVHVENKPGVLNRVASLFRRRAYNIESLTVGHTEKPGVSRMSITVETDEGGAARLEAHLYKLVNVLHVQNVTTMPAVFRELAMIKVAANHDDADWTHPVSDGVPRPRGGCRHRVAGSRGYGNRGQDR